MPPLLSRTKRFLEIAQEKHGKEKFGYSEVAYTKNNDKVKIRCVQHNIFFEITPLDHLQQIYG